MGRATELEKRRLAGRFFEWQSAYDGSALSRWRFTI
jgi:hypothetical protein